MTSTGRAAANRRNARLSTGPKSAEGKRRSAANATRHCLATAITSDLAINDQIESLARLIVGDNEDRANLACARRIVIAQLELVRMRTARREVINRIIADPAYEARGVKQMRTLSFLALAERIFKTQISVLRREWNALVTPRELSAPELMDSALEDLAEELRLLDRYERRALSRRKFAIREFDELVPTGSAKNGV